ncbi:hypothetical protein CPC08DRAFT_706940 [Agrocybe pediades]|nr:hypothetical protein CPC08DRAFT_706940 [Agrocybe pediades]
MPILNVKFPDQWPGWSIKECNLAGVAHSDMEKLSKYGGEQDIVSVSVDPRAITDYYSDSPVFRGTLSRRHPMSKAPTLIMKFAMREDFIEDLAQEASMYAGPLKTLQGTTIPESYGLYVGTLDDGQCVACLLLECWGDVIRKPFSQLPMQTRVRILERLGEIHKQGFLHGDFAERNVLQKNGDIRLIDFDQVVPDHHCNCDMDFRPGEPLPDQKNFGCRHLWEVCRNEMRIWKNRQN